MGFRYRKERYPKYSIKSWFGSPGKIVRQLWRRQIRARQVEALRKDPDGPMVREDYKLQKLDRWY